MTQPNRVPIMADVARLASVSVPTVSRVINAPHMVSASTRQRVEEAIEHLGYRPNLAARALVTQRTACIAAVVRADDHGCYPYAVRLEDVASARGLSIVLHVLRPATSLSRSLGSVYVDGYVCLFPGEAMAGLEREPGIPVAVIDTIDHNIAELTQVTVDSEARRSSTIVDDACEVALASVISHDIVQIRL